MALRLWAGRIAKHDAPTEPNINGYAEYMAYAGDSLKTGTWGSFLKEYEGKKKINQSDDNVGVLLIMGSTHSKVGKASVLSALSKN